MICQAQIPPHTPVQTEIIKHTKLDDNEPRQQELHAGPFLCRDQPLEADEIGEEVGRNQEQDVQK